MANPGTNYALNSDFEYTEFEFDSSQAQQAFNPLFESNSWPLFFMGRPLVNVAAVKLLEIQIPFTYYTIHSGEDGSTFTAASNNTFYLAEGPGPTVTKVSLFDGNYDSNTILVELATR